MGKIKTIAEREQLKADDNFSPEKEEFYREILAELEEFDGDGLPTDPEDYSWDGGAINGVRRLNDETVEAFRNSDLDERTALEQILLFVIDRYPNVSFPRQPKTKSGRVYRLEQAMKFLTGFKPKTGVKESEEDNLVEIARKYKGAALELQNDEDFIARLIVSVTQPRMLKSESLTNGQISDLAKNAKKDFEANFQRLMFKASEYEADEQIDRRARIQKIGDELLELIETSRPEPVSYRSTDEFALNPSADE